MISPILNKTSYELWFDRKPDISYFRVFGCPYFILNIGNQLSKFDTKADEGIFMGYSSRSTTYRIYNKRTKIVRELTKVRFDEIEAEESEEKKKEKDDGIKESTENATKEK